jgi:glutathione S-transferase
MAATHIYRLVSSYTCPWVQRAAITLRAKGVAYDITYIDLKNKPDWFLKISPHGKVPVLIVDDQPLDEVVPPRLHPEDPIKRARHRAWMDFIPEFSKAMRGIYYATSAEEQREALKAAPKRLAKLEAALTDERGNDGPYFSGDRLCLVDTAYAPFLQRFALIEARMKTGLLKEFPRVQTWSDALMANDVIKGSVVPHFMSEFLVALRRHNAITASLFAAEAAE